MIIKLYSALNTAITFFIGFELFSLCFKLSFNKMIVGTEYRYKVKTNRLNKTYYIFLRGGGGQ